MATADLKSTPTPPELEAPRATGSGTEEVHTLKSGDRLRIEIRNFPEYSQDYQILENGTVDLNLAGSLNVQGMTRTEAEAAIALRYAKLLPQPVLDVRWLASRPLPVTLSSRESRTATVFSPESRTMHDSDAASAIAAGPKSLHGASGPE
jgi:polysaccharide biosynthesis/export protein